MNLHEDFSIDENRLDEHLKRSGHLLASYGDAASELKAKAAKKKLELEAYDSELYVKLRNSAERITENEIKARTRKDDKHKELQIELIEAEKNAGRMENLYRSMVKRVDILISMAYRQKAEIRASGF